MPIRNSLGSAWPAGAVGRVAAPVRTQVVDELRAAILDFRLKPGQRLVERELIEILGVSRPTVREALRELDSEGLVTVVPQRGTFVTSLTPDETADLYEARIAVEGVLVRKFAERASGTELSELDRAARHFAEGGSAGAEPMEMMRRRDDFTAALCAGAHSPPLTQLAQALRARVQLLRIKAMAAHHEQAADELVQIVTALRDGLTEHAVTLLAHNLRGAKDKALNTLAGARTPSPQELGRSGV